MSHISHSLTRHFNIKMQIVLKITASLMRLHRKNVPATNSAEVVNTATILNQYL